MKSPSGANRRSFLLFPALFLAAAVLGGCGRVPKIIILEDPLSAEEHVTLGVAYERNGELASAAREYDRALKKDGKSVRARINLGNVRLAEKKFAEARDEYGKALELRPGDPEATNNLAWAAIRSGNGLEEALRGMDAVLSARAKGPPPADRLTPSLLDTRGVLLTRLHRTAEAISAFDQAEAACGAPEIVPGTPEAGKLPGCTDEMLREIRTHREEARTSVPSPPAATPLVK